MAGSVRGGLCMLKGKDGHKETFGEQISNWTLIFATCLPAHMDQVCTLTGNCPAQNLIVLLWDSGDVQT